MPAWTLSTLVNSIDAFSSNCIILMLGKYKYAFSISQVLHYILLCRVVVDIFVKKGELWNLIGCWYFNENCADSM